MTRNEVREAGNFCPGSKLIFEGLLVFQKHHAEDGDDLGSTDETHEARQETYRGLRVVHDDVGDEKTGASGATLHEQGRLAAALTGWRDRATAAFLAGYDEIMTGQRLWPADPRSARELLNFFLLERAVNDIEYELSHRPELLRVPAPLTQVPWDLAKDEFGARGADFLGVVSTLLLRSAKDQFQAYRGEQTGVPGTVPASAGKRQMRSPPY